MCIPRYSVTISTDVDRLDSVPSTTAQERASFTDTNFHRVSSLASPTSKRFGSFQIYRRPESYIAPYLSSLQERCQKLVQVGSYPVPGKGVFVSLIGGDPCGQKEDGKPLFLAEIASEVEQEINGRVVSDEEIAEKKGEESGRVQSKF